MRRTLFLTLSLLLAITGCTPGAKYQPPFLPIEFSINSDGEIAVTRNHRIVTKVGTFTLEAAAGLDLNGPASETLLVINHRSGGQYVQSRYRLGVGGSLGKVCVDGRAELVPDPGSNTVVVTAGDGSTRITVVGRAESCPAPRPSPTPAPPAPGATFTKVTFGKTREGYAPYHLNITFTGLRGKDCLVKWQTRYTDTNPNTIADTSGSIRTGTLPHDDDNWWIDELMVKAPSANRRWGTVFTAYCPDDVLLASGW